jgi:putative oxidoreductase
MCPGCRVSPAGDCGCSYAFFRVLVGLMFMQHGAQKLFGVFGGPQSMPVELWSLFGLAGVIEFFGGLCVVLGLWTRLVAVIAVIEMIVALAMVHFRISWVPLLNGGETAVLFLAAYALMAKWGNGRWSLERALFKREVF